MSTGTLSAMFSNPFEHSVMFTGALEHIVDSSHHKVSISSDRHKGGSNIIVRANIADSLQQTPYLRKSDFKNRPVLVISDASFALGNAKNGNG